MPYRLKTVKCPECGYTYQLVLSEDDNNCEHLCVRCFQKKEKAKETREAHIKIR
ncbi:MAG: hypothetical protein WED07_09355 [Candidatus Freyarchaeum deiterrae]